MAMRCRRACARVMLLRVASMQRIRRVFSRQSVLLSPARVLRGLKGHRAKTRSLEGCVRLSKHGCIGLHGFSALQILLFDTLPARITRAPRPNDLLERCELSIYSYDSIVEAGTA